MSSPPNYATSPPYPASISLPKKRPSASTAGPGNTKRRKPSISSASHPLRQTSFPPENNAGTSRSPSYSPTVDDSLSVVGGRAARSVTGASSVGGGGRGRKGKARVGNTDARSSIRGRSEAGDGRGSVVDGAGGVRPEDEDAEDEEGDGAEDAVLEGKEDEATWKMQREHLAMLVNAFNDDQMDRYNIWRRIKLKKETVRKLTNQTLSQSVSPGIIMAINGYTKVFIGELIERAREVQTEWLAAAKTLSAGESDLPDPSSMRKVNLAAEMTNILQYKRSESSMNAEDVPLEQSQESEMETSQLGNSSIVSRFHVEERDRGPLLPDHLREALRRYKKDREGGSAGFQGMSLHGKEMVASRAGGRRLFR